MWSTVRIFCLCILLGITAAKLPQANVWYRDILDRFDNRPAVTVLFLGNSRTFTNDMPFMVSKIADSAHSLKKYSITMYAKPSLKLEDLWNDPQVQKLLAQKWDYVVLQGASTEQVNESSNSSFLTYGTKLADAAKATGAMPVLLVAWKCSDDYYPQLKEIMPRFYDMIQASYSDLGAATGAPLVNVGRVWERVRLASTEPLMVDGNHPTVRGSYLIALMFYHFFSGDNLANVTYAPDGVQLNDANMLRQAAQQW